MNKIYKILFLAVLGASSTGVYAKSCSIDTPDITQSPMGAVAGDVYLTTTYWQTCWKNVTAEEFKDAALDQIEDIRTVHNMQYHVPVMQQDISNTNDMILSMNNQTKTVVQSMNDAYNAMAEAKLTIGKGLLSKKMEYMRHMAEASMNEENSFFNDNNGADGNINKNTQSYSYFKNLCKRNKMFLTATSPEQQVKKSMAVAKGVNKATAQAVQNSSQATQGRQKIDAHFKNWCSAEEIKNGICETQELSLCDSSPTGVCKGGEEFKLANGDMDSTNFVNPEGFKDHNSIPDELFYTHYTYDEDQEKAAKDFAYNSVYAGSITAPSIQEKQDPTKASFVYAYQSHLAALDLAHFSFENAIANRLPITDTDADVVMSEADVVEYIMSDLKNPDNMITATASDKALDVAMYSVLAIKNKLELNKLEQDQRIEALLAAIVAKIATSPNNMKYSEQLDK